MKVCCFCRNFLLLVAVFFAVASSTVHSQAPAARLRDGIREGRRAVLPGSMSPRVLQAKDLGPVRGDQVLHGMTLVFRRSEAQEAELQQLLKAQQDPTSSSFHRWLTPESFGQRFGMAEEDLEAAKQWLSGQGFVVAGVSRGRDRVTFSGTAVQVATAFSAPLHRYMMDGEEHVAPSADLSMPGDLAAVTSAVLHLSDFRARPNVHPNFTASADQSHYLLPGDLAVMYNLPRAYDLTAAPGSGQSIAIVGQSYVDLSGSSRFRGFSSDLLTQSISLVLVPNTGVEAVSPEDAAESEIDLEYAGGIAPKASLFLVHVGNDQNYDVFDALGYAIDENLAPVISISYSECETLFSSSELLQGDALFEQAGAQGQTLVAASGDSGSTGCVRFSAAGTFSSAEQQALAVGYPASSPYVTAVGGTQMALGTFATGNTAYWSSSTYGSDVVNSLLSYVPEVVWNEGSASRIFAGGGGSSAAYSRPSWQSGVAGLPSGATRLVPDLAFQASSANPGFLICTDDASFLGSEGQSIGCNEGLRGDNGEFTTAGGTSFAAPVFAAMTALLNQQQHAIGQGNVNPTLYGIAANSSTSGSVFHDIVSGSIACLPGSPLCSAAGQSGYFASTGFDQATGLGSVDFGHLAAAWPAGPGAALSGSLLQVYPQDTTVAPGATDGLNLILSPVPFENGTAPTGSVSITLDGAVVEPALAVSPSSVGESTAGYVLTLPSSPGSHVAVVTYAGDAMHGPSSAAVSISVGGVFASGGITLSAGNVTLPANGSSSTTVTVTPNGGYSGRLFWSLALTGGNGGSATGCYFIPDVRVQGATSTTLSLATGTSCSAPLPAARGAFRVIGAAGATKAADDGLWPSASVAGGLLLCCLLPILRGRRLLPLLCLALVATGSALSGCGSGSGGGGGGATVGTTPAAAASVYTATLTGRDSVNGAITASTNFTLTLQ